MYCCLLVVLYFTSNPSNLKHALWASIILMQSGSSSPLKTTHSSRGFFVSGQQQQMGLPLLMPTFFFLGSGGVEAALPMVYNVLIKRSNNAIDCDCLVTVWPVEC